MNFPVRLSSLTYDGCCLLSNVCWSRERVVDRLQRRFCGNSTRSSFDLKSLLPEQPSTRTKVSRSLFKFHPPATSATDRDDDYQSTSEEETVQEMQPVSSPNLSDDYLNKLASWGSQDCRRHDDSDDADDDDDVTESIPVPEEPKPSASTDILAGEPNTEVEDLLITFARRSVKSEPIDFADTGLIPSQLDGQDEAFGGASSTGSKRKRQSRKQKKPTETDADARNAYRQMKIYDFDCAVVEKKPASLSTLRTEKSASTRRKRRSTAIHNGKTIRDYFPVIPRIVERERTARAADHDKPKSDNYFDGCIVIDDNDDEEETVTYKLQTIEKQSFSIWSTNHLRERLLDHTIHSSSMRTKWLTNVELLLFEHIAHCHEQHIRPSNDFYYDPLIKCEPIDQPPTYPLNFSLISTIIVNFLKLFVIRNSAVSDADFMFHQHGITSHLRYLLIELPTYNHTEDVHCFQCEECSTTVQTLFDLLFDLLEHDLCGMVMKTTYRSSLIEDDYFSEFAQQSNGENRNSEKFFRIKLVIYFIELLELHRRKCPSAGAFVFHTHEDRIFQWIEDILCHIVQRDESPTDEKVSIGFNVMELCVLFATERTRRIEQMAQLLARLCGKHVDCWRRFVLNEDLLIDVRLLLINELICKEFGTRLVSFDSIQNVFRNMEMTLKSSDQPMDTALLIGRSLFSTFADLAIELKSSNFTPSVHFQQMTDTLAHHLDAMCSVLTTLSRETADRAVIFFRLLQLKWRTL